MTLAIAAPAHPRAVGTAQNTSVSLAMIQTLRDPGGFAATLAVHQPGVPMPAKGDTALATPLPVAATPGKIMPPIGKPVPAAAPQDMPRPAPAARDKAAKPASADTTVSNADSSLPPAPSLPAIAMPAAQTAPAPDRPPPQNAGAQMQPVAKTNPTQSETAQSDGAQPATSAGASATTPAPAIQPDPTGLAVPVAQAMQTFVASMTVAGQTMAAQNTQPQLSPANPRAQGIARNGRNAGQAPAAITTTPQLADGPATASAPRAARPATAPAPAPRPTAAEAKAPATDERPNPAGDAAPGSPIAPAVAPAMASSTPLFTPGPAAAAPTDFATLVDSIARARAEQPSAPGATVGVTLTHADFGRVGLQFSPNSNGASAALSVTLHSADPGFAPAVAAATAPSAASAHANPHGGNQPGQQPATGPAPDPLTRNGDTDAQAGSGQRPREDGNRQSNTAARATAAQNAETSGSEPDETGIFA